MKNTKLIPFIGFGGLRKTLSALVIVCAGSLIFSSVYAGTAVGNPGKQTVIGSSSTVKAGTAVGNPGR